MSLIKMKDLRVLREQRGFSKKEAAQKLRISEATLSLLEQGTCQDEDRHVLMRNYINFLRGREPQPNKAQQIRDFRKRLGISNKYAAKIIHKTVASYKSKECGANQFTKEEFELLMNVFKQFQKEDF